MIRILTDEEVARCDERQPFYEMVADVQSDEWKSGTEQIRAALPVIRKCDPELAKHLEGLCAEADECRAIVHANTEGR